ncbi:response regulator [soil metagenome]
MSVSSSQIRLLLVEDVPQVAHYVRDLLNAQDKIQLLSVLLDGRDVVDQVRQVRPDVVMVDALLQGKVSGAKVVESVRQAGSDVPMIIITVPQTPVRVTREMGIAFVLNMPFSGFELINTIVGAHAAHQASSPAATCRIYSVFAPKGGVGKTTLAFNLTVSIAQSSSLKVALVDGSLQFADLRALLKVPREAPSILDLPTDRVTDSDLTDVLWRDPSGIDILLAPPRVEMAEMVTTRDVGKLLSLLRRVYNVVLIDTPPGLSEVVLAFLDASDGIIQIVTYDSTTLHNTRSVGETFRTIGYGDKVRYLLNRADSAGGMDPRALEEILGRRPDFTVVSDGRLVVESNNQGIPFVLANPAAPISQDVARIAAAIAGSAERVPAATHR